MGDAWGGKAISAPKPIRAVQAIGKHFATLNLFRESDGMVEITVAGGSEALNMDLLHKIEVRSIDYVEQLIIEAAERIKARRS